MSIIYNQRIFDSGLNVWVYYNTIDTTTDSPLSSQTTPNHSGSLITASHEIVSETSVFSTDYAGYVSPSEMWTLYSTGQSVTIYDSAWDGTTLVLVGQGGLVITTTDFIEWTVQTSGTASSLYAAEWSGTEFWAVGDAGAVIRSADGVSWSSESTGLGANLRGVAFNGSVVLVNGYGGSVATRPIGGGAWTVQTTGTTLVLRKSVWDGTNFVVCSVAYMSYSADGASWTHVALPAAFTGVIMRDVDDDGAGTLVAVGDGGHVASSTDSGVTWGEEASVTAENLYGVSWTGALWIAVGANGVAVSSTDSALWAVQDTFSSETFRSSTWNGNALIATGTNGTMMASSSGIEFLADQNTGIYNPSDNVVGIVSGGVHAGSFILRTGKTQLLLGDGDYTFPSLGIGQSDNGLYASNPGEVAVRVNGAWGASWVKAGGGHGQLTLASGTVAEPSLSISSNGLYSPSVNELGISVQGSTAVVIRENVAAASGAQILWDVRGTVDQSGTAQYDALKLSITENTTGSGENHFAAFYRGGTMYANVDTAGRARMGDASAAAPSHSFVNNTTTGMYSDGTNVLAFAQAGSDVMQAVSQTAGSSGSESFFVLSGDVNQSGTAGYAFMDIQATHTAVGSGAQLAIKYSVGGTQKFGLGADGAFTALSYLFQGDENTGVVSLAADNVGVQAGGITIYDGKASVSGASGSEHLANIIGEIAQSGTAEGDLLRLSLTATSLGSGGGWLMRGYTGGSPNSGITSDGTMRAYDGTVSAPGFAFYGDTNSGMRRVSEDVLALACGSNDVLTLTHQLTAAAGDERIASIVGDISQSATAVYHGIYVDITETSFGTGGYLLNLLRGGAQQMYVNRTGEVLAQNGSASAPTFSFVGDPNTGVYWVSADMLGLSSGGTQMYAGRSSVSGASGTEALTSISGTVNQSATAGYNGLSVDITEATTGSGTRNLFSLSLGGASRFAVSSAGDVTVIGTVDGRDVATDGATLDAHIAAASGAHAGSSISNTPAGNIAAIDVQAAINELDGEKAGLALANTLTGNNTFNGTSDFNGAVTVDAAIAISALLTLSRTGDENALISTTDTPTDQYNLLFEFAIDGTNGIYVRFYSYDADGFAITINCVWGGSSWSSDYSSADAIMYYFGTVYGRSLGLFYKTATASTWIDSTWTHISNFNNNGEITTTSTSTFTVQAAAEGSAINGAGEYAGATVSFGRKLAAAPTSYSYTAIANLNQSTESVSTAGDSQYGAAMVVSSAAAGRFYSRGTVVVTP